MITLIERRSIGAKDVLCTLNSHGQTVWEAIPQEIRDSDATVQVVLNDEELNDEALHVKTLNDGDVLVVRVVPGFFPLLLPLATASLTGGLTAGAAAGVAGAVAAFITGTLLPTLISTGVGIGLNYLINAITGPSKQKTKKPSATYDFEVPQNTTENGSPRGLLYGEFRIGGQILQAKTEQLPNDKTQLSVLIGLGDGGDEGWESIAGFTSDVDDSEDITNDLEINGSPATLYRDIKVSVRLGTKHQAIIPGFEGTVVETVPFDLVITTTTPTVYTMTAPADRVKVSAQFRQGLNTTSSTSGNLGHRTVVWRLRWKLVTDSVYPNENTHDITVRKKSTTIITSEYTIENLNNALYDIEVSRVTEDSSSNFIKDEMTFAALISSIDDDIAYTSKALIAIKAIATDQLSGQMPTITVKCKGIKCRVYTDPTTYSYQYTRNTSWVILDLLRGRHALNLPENRWLPNINHYIDAAAHCAELVPDARRVTQEERALIDIYLDERRSAWLWILDIAQTADLVLLRGSGVYFIKPVKAATPVMMFNQSNMREFKVGYASPFERVNYLAVRYWDAELNYLDSTVVSLDESAVSETDDYIKDEMEVRGIVRKSQALRIGNHKINAAKLLLRIATWKTGVIGLRCEPNDIVEVAEPKVHWGIGSGTIKTVRSISAVIIDRYVVLEPGKSYQMRIWHNDGSFEDRNIANTAGERRTIVVSPPWGTLPVVGEFYSIGEPTFNTKLFLISDVVAQPDFSREITAIEFNPLALSDEIVQLPELDRRVGFDSRAIPPNPTNLRATERIITLSDGSLEIAVDVSWSEVVSALVAGYYVWVRESDDSAFTDTPRAGPEKSGYVRLDGDFIRNKSYDIAVTSISKFGLYASPELVPFVTLVIKGDVNRPSDVTGFAVSRVGDTLVFSWNAVPEQNVTYEIRTGTDWDSGVVVVGDWKSVVYETKLFFADTENPVTQTFLIKAKSASQNYSLNATSLAFTIDPKTDVNLIVARDERTLDWPGTPEAGHISILGVAPNRYLELVDTTAPYDGTYETPEIDLGAIYPSNISAYVDAEQIDTTLTWALATFSWESTEAQNRTWRGPANANNLGVILQAKYGTTSPIPAAYDTFIPTRQSLRYARFKIILSTTDNKFTARVNNFRALFDVDDVLDSDTNVQINGGIANITYNKQFTALDKISIQVTVTPGNGATKFGSGDYYRLTNQSLTGFTITLYNDSDVQLSGTDNARLDWFVRGI